MLCHARTVTVPWGVVKREVLDCGAVTISGNIRGLRDRAVVFADARALTISEALRHLIVRGLGGDEPAAARVNDEFRRVRAIWTAASPVPVDGVGGRQPQGARADAGYVYVRVPRALGARVRAAGGIAAVVERGLGRVGL